MSPARDLPDGLEIRSYTGEGYDRTFTYETWRIAFLNYAERFDHITYLERHLHTDEVFVLLEGRADLLVGETRVSVPMEKNRLYTVKAGVWHNVRVSRDAKVLVIENSDTGRENSEYLSL